MSVNRVILIGNVVADPELKHFKDNTPVLNISIATSEKWKDKTTGEQKESAQFHRCVFTGKAAEVIAEHVRKGTSLYVEGSINYRSYDKEGVKTYITEIKAHQFQFLGGKGEKNEPAVGQEFNDDQIPF